VDIYLYSPYEMDREHFTFRTCLDLGNQHKARSKQQYSLPSFHIKTKAWSRNWVFLENSKEFKYRPYNLRSVSLNVFTDIGLNVMRSYNDPT